MPRHELRHADGRRIVIRTALSNLQFTDARTRESGELPAAWGPALREHGLTVDQTITAHWSAADTAGDTPAQTRAADDRVYPERHVEVAAEPPDDHTLLLAIEIDGVLQWYVPVNAHRLLPVHARMLRETDTASVPDKSLRFVVPATFFTGSAAPAAEARVGRAGAGGVTNCLMHVVRVPLVRELIDGPISWLIEFIVKHVDTKREGFRFIDPARGFPFCTQADLDGMRDQRVLLMTHGVFSGTDAFTNVANDAALAAHLASIYGNRIIGWDHRTVAKSPLDNADEMLSSLPPGIQPDFICHSRGSLVMRAALEDESLQQKRQTKFNSVGTAMFVAGANQGSELASFQHVNELLNVYSAVASLPVLGEFGIALGVIVGVLRVLAHGASTIPAVKALSTDPDNDFLAALNQPLRTTIGQLIVLRANFDPAGNAALEALNANIDVIFGVGNDLVVPFGGAVVFDQGVRPDFDKTFGTEGASQSDIMHTNFFDHAVVRGIIADRFQ